MKKLFASLLAALMLCAGLTQYAFAANIPDDQPNQPPVEDKNDDEQGKKPSGEDANMEQGPKNIIHGYSSLPDAEALERRKAGRPP